MRTILDANGVVQACGETVSLSPPEGGSVIEADTTAILLSLTADEVAYYDGKAFGKRARVPDPDETDRADIQTRLQSALTNWATLSVAQKDALLKVCVRAALRGLR